ncbi:MAG: DUF4861 family protein [Cyclobacteriaceae bacterium]
MKFNLAKTLSLAFMIILISACGETNQTIQISVENPSAFSRNDVISIKRTDLSALLEDKAEDGIVIKEKGKEIYLVTQWLDADQDGVAEELLFQVDLDANQSKELEAMYAGNASELIPKSEMSTFSRFVPERTDDYAWENDKVAFRTFGPEAQRRIEENEKGGTLSSGIDLWLKRVSYPVIDKWYAGNVEDPGYYHIDHGEGHDPFHVGTSRGAGGVGVWEDDTLMTSRNFVSYKTIATGPLRTVFDLKYAEWSDYDIEETKRITLDLGSNFSKFETTLESESAPNFTIGITTHDSKAEPNLNESAGWYSTWEQIDSAYVGVGVVVDPQVVTKSLVFESETRDQSQVLIVCDPSQQSLTYYSGYGWTKSGQISSPADWQAMLDRQVEVVSKPLKITTE